VLLHVLLHVLFHVLLHLLEVVAGGQRFRRHAPRCRQARARVARAGRPAHGC